MVLGARLHTQLIDSEIAKFRKMGLSDEETVEHPSDVHEGPGDIYDLSPLTVLLLGCVVSAIVFSVVSKVLRSTAEASRKQRKKRRLTREEEEAIIEQQVRHEREIAVEEEKEDEDNARDGEEQKRPEEEQLLDQTIDLLSVRELKERITANGGDYHDCVEKDQLKARLRELILANQDNHNNEEEDAEEQAGEDEFAGASSVAGDSQPSMSKKDLKKAEKKKKKQEQQEAWRNMLEHQRRLRELREAEDKEREEAEREEEEERRQKEKEAMKLKPTARMVTDDELVKFILEHAKKEVPLKDIPKNFSFLGDAQLQKQLERVCGNRTKLPLIIMTDHGSFLKVHEADLARLRSIVKQRGSLTLDELIPELVAMS